MKARILSRSLVVFTLILLGLGQIAMAQGVISLPWTGQERCYNSSGTEISCTGTGQDGEYQMGTDWPDPRFTSSGDCMTDHLTGLMWSKNADLPNGTMTWQEAIDYVASLNSGAGLCGYHDWRLSNINELESLVNAGIVHLDEWLISQGFSNVRGTWIGYWSSTTSAVLTDDAWFSFMVIGYTGHASKGFNAQYVWPVRSGQLDNTDSLYLANIRKTGQTTSYASKDDGDLERGVAWPAPRFADPGDGTITDNLTGLMWSKNANLPNGTMTWQGALDYVKALNSGAGLGGNHDWRLPNKEELFSLTDFSRYHPALPNGHPFENVQSNIYWSSTASSNNHLIAWCLLIWDGTVSNNYKSDPYFVWPVRSDYPDISVTPNPVPFGNVKVEDTSDQSISVGNSGTANLVIGTITNPAAPFSKQTDNCSGQTLAPGGTCTVTYRFAPTTSGNFSSNSNIPSNDPDKDPVAVTLHGTGFTAFSISVSKSGSGTGTVTSNPAGINCGSDCSESYRQGTIVTLMATPDAGSIFGGWIGDADCSDAAVTLNADKICTATFNPQPVGYILTVTKSGTGNGAVTSSPAGINCGSDCNETYSKVQKVRLTAKADANSTFIGWSGSGYSGTGTCQVTVDSPKTITASFALKAPDISVAQTSLDFGGAKPGKSLKKKLGITNNGTGDLSINLEGLAGTDFSYSGSSSITVKPKKTYSLNLTFKPSSTGQRAAILKINSNDPDAQTIHISLSGTGI